MERLIEERRIDGHAVAILEDIANEDSGFFLVIDNIREDAGAMFGRIPTDGEIRNVIRSRTGGSGRTPPAAEPPPGPPSPPGPSAATR